jgi:hypothetical protein
LISSDFAAETDGVARIALESVQELLLKLALQMARDDFETQREKQRHGVQLAKAAGRLKISAVCPGLDRCRTSNYKFNCEVSRQNAWAEAVRALISCLTPKVSSHTIPRLPGTFTIAGRT